MCRRLPLGRRTANGAPALDPLAPRRTSSSLGDGCGNCTVVSGNCRLCEDFWLLEWRRSRLCLSPASPASKRSHASGIMKQLVFLREPSCPLWLLILGDASGIKLDRLHDASNRPARTRLVRLQPTPHRSKKPDQLSQHHVEHRSIVIGKVSRTVQRQVVIRKRGYIAASPRGHHCPNPPQALAIDLAQQIQFVSAPPRFTRQESDKQRLPIDARHGPVTQPERSLRHCRYFARAEFNHFECGFICHRTQRSRPYKTRARAAEHRDRRGNFGRRRQELSSRLRHMCYEFPEVRKVFRVRDALPRQQHVAERTRHRQPAIVDRIIQHKRQCPVAVLRAQLRHRSLLVAGNHEVPDLPMPVERPLQQRNALWTLARPRKRNPQILSSWPVKLFEFRQQRGARNRPRVAVPLPS